MRKEFESVAEKDHEYKISCSLRPDETRQRAKEVENLCPDLRVVILWKEIHPGEVVRDAGGTYQAEIHLSDLPRTGEFSQPSRIIEYLQTGQ